MSLSHFDLDIANASTLRKPQTILNYTLNALTIIFDIPFRKLIKIDFVFNSTKFKPKQMNHTDLTYLTYSLQILSDNNILKRYIITIFLIFPELPVIPKLITGNSVMEFG